MNDTPSSRREFLGGVALVAAGALAGCTGGSASLDPELPAERLAADGWELGERIDETVTRTVEVGGAEQRVEVHTKAEVYANDGPLQAVDGAFDGVDLPPARFVAAKAETDPPVARLLALSDTALDRLVERAERAAKRRLRDRGFENIRTVSEGELEIESGATAEHRRYAADYAYGETTVTYGGREATVEPGTFTVEAQVALWPQGDLLAGTAGVYPGEEGTVTVSAGGETTEVSLGLEPGRYRESVRELTTRLS